MKRIRILTKLTLEGMADLPDEAQVLDVQPSSFRTGDDRIPEWHIVYAVPEEI